MSDSGLELVASLNSTSILLNTAFTLSVTEVNTRPAVNNVTAGSAWRLSNLTWITTCGDNGYLPLDYLPHRIELLKGYYTLNNVTSGNELLFWGAIPAGPGCLGLSNIGSYAFQPNSDNASLVTAKHVKLSSTSMLSTILIFANDDITATTQDRLDSSSPGVYTIAAGDEWGALVLFHFSVT